MSAVLLCGAVNAATTLFTEGFEGSFPPSGWTENSIEQSPTYTFNGTYSAKFSANSDYLITPAISNATTFIFWSYTTAADPQIIVEQASSASGPWTEFAESPFAGDTEQWNGRWVTLTDSQPVYIRLRKNGTGSLYIDDAAAEDDGTPPANHPPVLEAIGNRVVNEGQVLMFLVSATDADNDPLTYTASNLPPGAVFSTHTITPQFIWSPAGPAGIYTPSFYVDDGTTNDVETVTITVTNQPTPPSLTGAVWNVVWNLPYQSASGSDYPGQFEIRNALVERINALQNGNSAVLATFTFSAEEGGGAVMNAMNAALDRGATLSFIADGDINLGTVYGGTNSLLSLSSRPVNPLILAVDGSTSGIMHNKLGLFDYGGSNQWVFVASWNFTLGASANQWNIALEARSPSLYSVYKAEAVELLAGRFHDDPAKSHAHDGSVFPLDGSWGTNFVRFSPPPTGDSVEDDIIVLINGAQSNIVFALNKLNREPIRDALIAAAGRGVEIQGVMPRSDTDPGGVSDDVYAALTNYVEFLPAYAKADYSGLDSGEPDLIHAKYMVIDSGTSNAIVIHGSANWTAHALVNDNDNDENTLILRHNAIAETFREHFGRITGTGVYSEGNSTLVSWDFEDGDQIADGGIAANSAQPVVRVPEPSSYTYTANALSCSGWSGGNGTTYWETSFDTTRHTDIKVSSRQLASSTGPADFKLQYKPGAGGTYTDVPYSAVHVPNGGNGLLTRVLLPEECNNQPVVFLRWIMTSDIAANGGTIGSTGAGRIDDIIITGTAYNQPPVLDPPGDQTVFTGEALSFAVTAADPVDGDAFIITASNLPTGAVFTNDTFIWNIAAPSGIYTPIFTVIDKDGSNSETVTISVIEKPQLLISEIADPSESAEFRFVELYNAGTDPIDLADGNWTLSRQNNGGGTWYEVALTGTIAAAETYVIAKSPDEFLTAYGLASQQGGSAADGNGNDAMYLFYGGSHTDGILIDLYGEPDTDGTDSAWDYEDSRAERNKDVLGPNRIWIASEWTITPDATTNKMTPGVHGPAPEFQGLENQFVFLGDDLNLAVTATNTIRPDVITLAAIDLPEGALFPSATGTNSVSSLLFWSSPPAGVYNATLAASGAVGSATRSLVITVSDTAEIDGEFSGWKYDTIVKLDNGQFWRNTGGAGSIIDPPLRDPQVTVTKAFGKYRMTVEGVAYTTVEQIDVNVSTPSNDPSGLHKGNLYELSDETVWEQISWSDSITFSTDPAIVWRWTANGKTYLRFLDRDNIALGTCEVVATQPSTGGPVVTQIDGYFRGWQHKRVFALANGEFWQQITADSSVDTLYRPDATLTNYLGTGTWRLYVDGASAPGYVEVQQLTAVTRTKIDGWFYGFGNGEFLKLQNGEWWRQTSLDTSASIRSNPEVLIWNSTIELPDEGRSVTAAPLDVFTETRFAGAFRGLRYAHIYTLANGQEWIQISSENIPSDAETPDAVLWTQDDATLLLVRDSNDRTIGTCTVVDPWADDDGDGILNANELIAGTSLSDRNDFFMIGDLQQDAQSRAVLRWVPVSGRTYTIEWTASLLQPFQPLETLADWTQDRWTDAVNPPGTGGFYRIRVQLTD